MEGITLNSEKKVARHEKIPREKKEIMPTEEILKIFEEKCRKGLHPFEEIMRAGYCWHDSEKVARWCPICGTVVVDVDVYGRMNAGMIMKARRPKILER